MNVLFIAAEAAPFAKVGGMADVVGSLPAALRQAGVDARVVLPGYGFIKHDKYQITHLFTYTVALREGNADVKVFTTMYDNIPFYFLQAYPYFGNEQTVYTDWNWDSPRFIFFNQIVMGFMWEMDARFGWFPDVAHVNDWHTGLVPFLIFESRHESRWARLASVISIHNLAYQGDHVGGWMYMAGIHGRHHPDLVYQNLTDNMLAIALAYSDMLSTVSPRYAIEIQYPYMGYGLDGLIRTRINDLYGILNGIDVNLWNPATDPDVKYHFSVDNFTEKRIDNKRYLQALLGLDVRDEPMLIGIVSRMVWQKGMDLAVPALSRLLAQYDVQVVALGTGEPQIEAQLRRLEQMFSRNTRCKLSYDGAVAQQIYAGCDLFLMPSHFEPCGTGQMVAMRYGALPLVRETGGLADTVENYDDGNAERGTGFVFQWEEAEAVFGTLRWAYTTYRDRRQAWQRMQKRAMERDFSWDKSARQYIEMYHKAIAKKM
jgi:starch synthase